MYTGTNCTNYVAYRLVTTNGMPNVRPKSSVGNARDWGTAMSSITNGTPTVGSVAWWGRTGNHVAYVEKVVSSTEIWVSESNWSGAFDWRKITKSGSGWPDGFIHFADRKIVNTAKPAIRGTVKVGTSLTAAVGEWSPQGNTYSYRWLAGGTSISGATGKTFTPTAAQLAQSLSVRVTATRPSYPAATATSPAKKVAPGTLSPATAPAITGTARVDETLTASTGTWAPGGSTYAYQWFVDDVLVPGASQSTFTPGPDNVAGRVTVQVTAARAGYNESTASSAPTDALAPGLLTATTQPSITGAARVGSQLSASPGTWSRSGLTYAHQWFVGGSAVSGANDPIFVPRAADLGLPVTVHVTGTRPGYAATTAVSAGTIEVARGTFTFSTAPRITGSPRLGSLLSVSPGAYTPANATRRYQWLRDGSVRRGATGSTRRVITGDLGHKLSTRVTYSAPGYTSRTVTTAPVGPAKATSAMRASAAPGTRKATFTIRVSAAGVAAPSGTVTVRYAGDQRRTVTVRDGRASLTLTGQATGLRTYRFRFGGTSTVTSATYSKKVTIR